MLIFLLSEFLPEICWDEVTEEIFSYFRFWCLTWALNRSLMSNKPTHYLLNYGDDPHNVCSKPISRTNFTTRTIPCFLIECINALRIWVLVDRKLSLSWRAVLRIHIVLLKVRLLSYFVWVEYTFSIQSFSIHFQTS